MSRFTRNGPPPNVVRTALIVRTDEHPALATWIWKHPWASAEVFRAVLRDACDDGTLDRLIKELEDGVSAPA